MKKFSIVFVCLIVFLSMCLVFPCFAEEPNTPSGETITENAEQTPADETPVVESPSEEVESGWTIGKFFDEYASTIFTVLSTLGVSIVAYLFKGALLPSMKNGLVALSDISQKTHDISEETAGRVHDAVNAVANVSDKILALTEQIRVSNATNSRQQEILFAVLLILKEGFTAAKLPEYTKDRINSAIDKVSKQMEGTANEETV